jgi:pyridoxamine 5'-phosphate oxidase
MSLSDLRREYRSHRLTEDVAAVDPIVQFRQWFDEALRAEALEANAMALATVSPDGEPSARTVLLKEFSDQGFVFYTNYESAKARDLESSTRACLLFFWAELERQVRITGTVTRVSREETAEYFKTRPRDSQIGAWVSPQSRVIPHRNVLEENFESLLAQYEGDTVPVPPFWGGYRVTPAKIEFWQGRPSRLHDRLLYTRSADGWKRVRLAP